MVTTRKLFMALVPISQTTPNKHFWHALYKGGAPSKSLFLPMFNCLTYSSDALLLKPNGRSYMLMSGTYRTSCPWAWVRYSLGWLGYSWWCCGVCLVTFSHPDCYLLLCLSSKIILTAWYIFAQHTVSLWCNQSLYLTSFLVALHEWLSLCRY